MLISNRQCCAQNISQDAQRLTDSIYNIRTDTCPDKYCWMRLYDSIQTELTATYFEEESKNGFFYPYEFASVEMTPTYCHLLEAEFGVRPYGIRSGCLSETWHRTFDSLTFITIEKKFGEHCFERAKSTSDSLDKANAGLQLPFIKSNKETIVRLEKAIRFTGTLMPVSDYPNADSNVTFIHIQFAKNKVLRAYVAREFLGYTQQDFAFGDFSETLSNLLAAYKWTGPAFKNKPVEANVLYNRRTNSLSFIP